MKVGDDIPLNIGCLGGLWRHDRRGRGDEHGQSAGRLTVAVFGCGGIGLSAVNGAAIGGADRIIAIDIISSKLDVAKLMGATDVINASNLTLSR